MLVRERGFIALSWRHLPAPLRRSVRLAALETVASGAILSDGTIALVLNVAGTVRAGLERRPTSAPPTLEAAPVERRRLLVVDDTITTRSLVKSLLEAAGYEVAVAAN